MPKQVAVRSKPLGDGWPLISSGRIATSPPGISTPACSAPVLEADADLLHHLGVGLLDREVVQQRDRLGADADHVIDVHGDAVDADGVVAAGLLGEDQLGADAVGADGDAEVRRDLEHGGVVAGLRAPTRLGLPVSIVLRTPTSAATARSAAC